MKIKINGSAVFLPPLLVRSESKDIGAAGFEYHGIIGVAEDFTSWFRGIVFLHELIHYFFNFLPTSFQKIGHHVNDKFLVKVARFLTLEEQNRGKLNMNQFYQNCWTIKVNFFPELSD